MPAHFRAFGRATNDPVWEEVIANSQAIIDSIQTNHSPVTGLLPDFIVNCSNVANCVPASSYFLEGPYDGHYYYNAGRDPWRIGLDALLNNDPTSQAAVQKMVSWVASNSGGNASNIKAGYRLNGTWIGDYFTSYFVAPFGVATMIDPAQQELLNDIYASVYNRHENYYEDSVNLLSLLVMTGNYWSPTTGEPLPARCADGLDNDNDGLIDYPNDPGCESADDNDESNVPPAICADGLDNDNDGLTDYPNDPGCSAADDNDETDPVNGHELDVQLNVTSDWNSGYCANVVVSNPNSYAVDWTISFTVEGIINNLWNANYQQSGNQVTAEGLSWNNLVSANGQVSFGFCAQR